MEEQIDLVVVAAEKPRSRGISIAIGVSLVLHVLLLILFVRAYRPIPRVASDIPIARYVELIKQNPQEQRFTEAPGPKIERAPTAAPLSDANRSASMPNPTGDRPTNRPGVGNTIYTPPSNPAPRGPRQAPSAPQMAQNPGTQSPEQQSSPPQKSVDSDRLVYRESSPKSPASASGVDWKSAIRNVQVASLGGGDGIDLGQVQGGENGFAEQGPLSFETSWFPWGEYAQSMVSRIRVNWIANMPENLRWGQKGRVKIRFTIHSDGRISDIEVLESSDIPVYDHAAEKAIALSSPLKPLPEGFPRPSERVTCTFFYNMQVTQ